MPPRGMEPSRAHQMRLGIKHSCMAFSNLAMREIRSEHAVQNSPQQLGRVRAVWKNASKWDINHKLQVCFIGGTPQEREQFQTMIMETYWPRPVGDDDFRLGLPEPNWDAPQASSDIRISFAETGSWSMLGNEALGVPKSEATLNIGWSMTADPAVAKHEWGHLLGLAHEHQSPAAKGKIQWADEQVLIDYFAQTQNPPWSAAQTRANVTEALDTNTYNSSHFDPESIMLYMFDCAMFANCGQGGDAPCNCTPQSNSMQVCAASCQGRPKTMNTNLSATDKQVLMEMYPRKEAPVVPPREPPVEEHLHCPKATHTPAFYGTMAALVLAVVLACLFLALWLRR